MIESVQSIIEWSRQTFPEATIGGQIQKFSDEMNELLQARTKFEKLFELADCFIVACSIGRFDTTTAITYFSLVYHMITERNILISDFEAAVDEKMKINRNRKWEIKHGNYQHKE